MTNKVHLDLSLDNGNTWQRVLSDQPANGYINWTVPNTPAQKCRMRVLDALDGSPLSPSANPFSIVAAGTPEENPTPVPAGNYALSFDGLNDLLQIANHPSLNISNAFTIEFWLKTDKPAQNWSRILDEVRLWNNARTNQEIVATMNKTMVGDEPGLAACYSFDEGSGQYAGDRTANANHGWLGGSNLIEQGDPTWVVSDRPVIVPSLQPTAPPAQEPENASLQPEIFTLHANYPNPFNSQTTIRFVLPESRTVRLAIYDVSGRLVKTLAEGSCNAGEHSVVWDGLNEMGEATSSGVYFYRITAGDWSATRRLVMVK